MLHHSAHVTYFMWGGPFTAAVPLQCPKLELRFRHLWTQLIHSPYIVYKFTYIGLRAAEMYFCPITSGVQLQVSFIHTNLYGKDSLEEISQQQKLKILAFFHESSNVR